MRERVDLVLGPGVESGIDTCRETEQFSLRIAFSPKHTESTDVVVHQLYSETGDIVPRSSIPDDALLLLMDTKSQDGWKRRIKKWAEVRGFSTTRGAIINYDMLSREHAEEQYARVVWVNAQTGFESLLRILGELRRLGQPLSLLMQQGIHYDFMYGQLFVRIAPAVWEELVKKAAKAYVKIPTVAGDKDVLISMEAYVDMLRASR